MRLLIIGVLIIQIIISGCHNHDHPHDPENPADAHLRAYLRLKKKSPESALIELTKHANAAFMEHPKAGEWAQLAFRMDRAEESSLPDMLHLRQLYLEMARDNEAPIEYIQILENQILFWEEMKKELKAEGRDPNTFYIKFSLKRK